MFTYCIFLKKICDKSCNLLLIEENDKSRYVRIKMLNRLMNTQSKDAHKILNQKTAIKYSASIVVCLTFHQKDTE